MKPPVRLLLVLLALAGFTVSPAQSPLPKPGYSVLLEVTYTEEGTPEEAKIVQTDDPTGDHQLEQLALSLASKDKQPPRLVDGKPVRFKARRPFNFPVEGDLGEAANANRPVLRAGNQKIPAYPPTLADQEIDGGAIVELTIRADGTVAGIRTLRSSHPEFAREVEQALGQWTFNPREGPGIPAESRWNAAVGFTSRGQSVELKWRLAPRPSLGSFVVGRLPKVAPAAPAAPETTPAPAK